MEKALNWFTHKKMFVMGVLGFGVFLASYYNREIGLPSVYKTFCCLDDRNFNLFAVAVPFFVFSFAFMQYKNDNFAKWKKFTFIYLFIYLFIYFVVPTQGDGYLWFQRETVSFFGTIIYSVISAVVVISGFVKSRQ